MNEMRPARDASREQAQFLRVLSREEAMARFRQALDPKPLGIEHVALAQALGRVVGDHIAAPVDVPPFDRSNVDGFALRAGDVARASDNSPVSLALNDETIACGTEPRLTVSAGTATPIATGGPIPRGADAVVMIEQTEIEDERLLVRRPVGPAQNISFAGSDIALGEVVLRKGTQIGSREIAMLAACGIDRVAVFGKTRVGVFSTGDELIAPGNKLKSGGDLRFQRADRRREHCGEWRRAGFVRHCQRQCRGDRRHAAQSACRMRHGRFIRRHIERRRRPYRRHCREPRQARHCCAWRRAETRQAALSCGCRR